MFTIDSAMAAEIEYRSRRVREVWVPRKRRIRADGGPRRRLHVGPRPAGVGTVAAAR